MSKSNDIKRRGRSRPAPDAPMVARTPKGRATQAALVRAARKIFERDGFLDARIVDITAAARSSTGSFYSYFDNKEEIFGAVVAAVEEEEMLHPPTFDYLTDPGDDLVARIAEHHRDYLAAYQRNAKLMTVIDEVTNVSASYRRRRAARAQEYMERNAAAVRELQATGRADPSLDPMSASRALSIMVSRAAYVTCILEEEPVTETLVETLTRLWINALGIPVDEARLAELAAADGARR